MSIVGRVEGETRPRIALQLVDPNVGSIRSDGERQPAAVVGEGRFQVAARLADRIQQVAVGVAPGEHAVGRLRAAQVEEHVGPFCLQKLAICANFRMLNTENP